LVIAPAFYFSFLFLVLQRWLLYSDTDSNSNMQR